MGAQMQRGAYSRVCGAATAKRPAALGYAGAGPAQRATGSRLSGAARRQDPLLTPAPVPLAQNLLIGQDRLRRVPARGFWDEREGGFHANPWDVFWLITSLGAAGELFRSPKKGCENHLELPFG